jgi:GNAT superfamily N-acetyltransferase
VRTPPAAGSQEPAAGGVVVRDARQDELGAIESLTLAAYGEYATTMAPGAWRGLEGAVRAALASPEPAERIVAALDGRLVGSVMLFPPSTDAYAGLAARATWPELRLLAVSPDARTLGVGRLLVEECIRRARRVGAREIGLHTSVSMRAARALYQRMGFVRVPEHDFRPEGAELVEAYRLALD